MRRHLGLATAVLCGLLLPTAGAATMSGIAVNELLADPNSGGSGFDTDGDGDSETSDEFIEFYNTTGVPVDISGWEMYVTSGGSNSIRHTFAASSSVPANGFFALVNEWNPGVPPANFAVMDAGGSGVLGNSGDNVVIYNPGSGEFMSLVYNGDPHTTDGLPAGATTNVGTIDLGPDVDTQSISAVPDGSENFVVRGPTPGAANIPEPSTASLLGIVALIGAVVARSRKRLH